MSLARWQPPLRTPSEWWSVTIRTLAIVIVCTGLLTLCAGCARTPVIEVQTVKQLPPAHLLLPCPHPEIPTQLSIVTDTIELLLDYQAALNACNADKRALRQFYAQ